MKIELLRPWRWFKRGHIADMATGRALHLCSLGIAARVVDEPQEPRKPTAKPKPEAPAAGDEPKQKPKRRRVRKLK